MLQISHDLFNFPGKKILLYTIRTCMYYYNLSIKSGCIYVKVTRDVIVIQYNMYNLYVLRST